MERKRMSFTLRCILCTLAGMVVAAILFASNSAHADITYGLPKKEPSKFVVLCAPNERVLNDLINAEENILNVSAPGVTINGFGQAVCVTVTKK